MRLQIEKTAQRLGGGFGVLSASRAASSTRKRRSLAEARRCIPEDAIATTLDSLYLSRDPHPTRKAAYTKRTMAKARSGVQREGTADSTHNYKTGP